MFDYFNHGLLVVRLGLIALAILINFILGMLYFRNALKRHDIDLALAIMMGLLAIILAVVPYDYYLWNYLAIGWGVLLFIVVLKIYFGEIITKGTRTQKICLVLGLLLILAVVIFSPYIKWPEFLDYIPSF